MSDIKKREKGGWLRYQCYRCGHRLALASTACPQCGEEFDGVIRKRMPDKCECVRCAAYRAKGDSEMALVVSPKAMKLLEALAGDHDTPNGGDHAWRTCRRCLAEEELATKSAHALICEIHIAVKAWARREL